MSDPASGMSSFAKAAILVMAAFVLFGTILLAAGWIWWKRNQEEIMQGSAKARDQGWQAGKNLTEKQCFDKAVSKTSDGTGFSDMIANGVFLGSCLEASQPVDGFCKDVPKDTEFTRSIQWRKAKCKDMKLEQNECSALLSVVQRYCHEDRNRLGKGKKSS